MRYSTLWNILWNILSYFSFRISHNVTQRHSIAQLLVASRPSTIALGSDIALLSSLYLCYLYIYVTCIILTHVYLLLQGQMVASKVSAWLFWFVTNWALWWRIFSILAIRSHCQQPATWEQQQQQQQKQQPKFLWAFCILHSCTCFGSLWPWGNVQTATHPEISISQTVR